MWILWFIITCPMLVSNAGIKMKVEHWGLQFLQLSVLVMLKKCIYSTLIDTSATQANFFNLLSFFRYNSLLHHSPLYNEIRLMCSLKHQFFFLKDVGRQAFLHMAHANHRPLRPYCSVPMAVLKTKEPLLLHCVHLHRTALKLKWKRNHLLQPWNRKLKQGLKHLLWWHNIEFLIRAGWGWGGGDNCRLIPSRN